MHRKYTGEVVGGGALFETTPPPGSSRITLLARTTASRLLLGTTHACEQKRKDNGLKTRGVELDSFLETGLCIFLKTFKMSFFVRSDSNDKLEAGCWLSIGNQLALL